MTNRPRQSVRIIAGTWRRRRLSFLASKDLRPTPDRVRETLFNWLGAYLPGARCADLFAGSGALGFEAASRGAESVTLVEADRDVAATLAEHVRSLEAANVVAVVQADALAWSQQVQESVDIVFLDPPYSSFNVFDICATLARSRLLSEGGLVYFECLQTVADEQLPEGWTVLRAQRAGRVRYHLVNVAV